MLLLKPPLVFQFSALTRSPTFLAGIHLGIYLFSFEGISGNQITSSFVFY